MDDENPYRAPGIAAVLEVDRPATITTTANSEVRYWLGVYCLSASVVVVTTLVFIFMRGGTSALEAMFRPDGIPLAIAWFGVCVVGHVAIWITVIDLVRQRRGRLVRAVSLIVAVLVLQMMVIPIYWWLEMRRMPK